MLHAFVSNFTVLIFLGLFVLDILSGGCYAPYMEMRSTVLSILYNVHVVFKEILTLVYYMYSVYYTPSSMSLNMTASQLNPSFECGEGMKVKVVKWC